MPPPYPLLLFRLPSAKNLQSLILVSWSDIDILTGTKFLDYVLRKMLKQSNSTLKEIGHGHSLRHNQRGMAEIFRSLKSYKQNYFKVIDLSRIYSSDYEQWFQVEAISNDMSTIETTVRGHRSVYAGKFHCASVSCHHRCHLLKKWTDVWIGSISTALPSQGFVPSRSRAFREERGLRFPNSGW